MKKRQAESTCVRDAEIGSRIRGRREELRLSQRAIAAMLGISAPQYQKYEAGKNRLGPARLEELAGLLNVPVSHFFSTPERPPAPPTVDAVVRLVNAFGAIKTAESQSVLIDIAERMASDLATGLPEPSRAHERSVEKQDH